MAAADLWQRREAFVAQAPGVEESIELALRAEPPVCLLDMGDNIGGGSPADSTWLAHALFDKQVERSLIALYDPEAVRKSQKAGAGATLELHLGDHSGSPNGGPLVARCRVESLHEAPVQHALGGAPRRGSREVRRSSRGGSRRAT